MVWTRGFVGVNGVLVFGDAGPTKDMLELLWDILMADIQLFLNLICRFREFMEVVDLPLFNASYTSSRS